MSTQMLVVLVIVACRRCRLGPRFGQTGALSPRCPGDAACRLALGAHQSARRPAQPYPGALVPRSAFQFNEGDSPTVMLRENMVAERVTAAVYRDLVRYFSEKDPATQLALERILAQEEEHVNEMQDVLGFHEAY